MNKFSIILFFLILLAITGFTSFYNKKEAALPILEEPSVLPAETEAVVRSQVLEFGQKLKNVSLLASTSEFRNQMNVSYKPYVSIELIKSWEESPSLALGRQTSSPWPDRIEIVEIAKQVDGSYKVEGNVIEVTSTNEPAAVYPVTLILLPQIDGDWMIVSAEKGAYSELPKRVTVEGRWECLPHKNTSGPQTMECAFGIVDGANLHYAVDTHLLATSPVDYTTGARLRVEGIMTPANQLSSDQWQKYAIQGIISATSIQKI